MEVVVGSLVVVLLRTDIVDFDVVGVDVVELVEEEAEYTITTVEKVPGAVELSGAVSPL